MGALEAWLRSELPQIEIPKIGHIRDLWDTDGLTDIERGKLLVYKVVQLGYAKAVGDIGVDIALAPIQVTAGQGVFGNVPAQIINAIEKGETFADIIGNVGDGIRDVFEDKRTFSYEPPTKRGVNVRGKVTVHLVYIRSSQVFVAIHKGFTIDENNQQHPFAFGVIGHVQENLANADDLGSGLALPHS